MKETLSPLVHGRDLGRIDHQEAWAHQLELLEVMVARKRANRGRAPEERDPQEHHLLFCEHSPVYTLGKSGSLDHLLLSEAELAQRGIQFHKTNRGGDITFHGPGQIVAYPILDLDCFFTDVHRYVRFLEEAIIRTLAEYGIQAGRETGYTGVWLDATEVLPTRKICAIGVHLRRWVTMHGLALNVNTDLTYFQHIIPCGIGDADKAVTSMALELGRTVELEEVKTRLRQHFAQLFEFEWAPE
ncbi:MAG: lipoyl(octanoyl) transferase LipB [Bacteroidota bacterium]